MSATNYARHRLTGEYVFLAQGERPRREWLTPDWVWYQHLTRAQIGDYEALYRVQFENAFTHCHRLDHAPRTCARCIQQVIAEGRRQRGIA